jgi:multiple sugar transport system permease protein
VSDVPRRGGKTLRAVGPTASKSTPWLLMSPALALLLLMTVVPAIYLVYASLHTQQLLGGTSHFVGLQNYRNAIGDATIRHSFFVTIQFVVIAVVAEMAIGLLLAVPLARKTRGSTVAAALLLLPFAITPAVSALIVREMLNPNYGWVDYYLGRIGLPAHIAWLDGTHSAWIAIVGLDVWQWTPFVTLILIAGLQALPQEPTEAASIDGATRWQIFRHVTLPMLMPFIAIAVVIRTIQAFKTFDAFEILTGGGPGNSTDAINLNVYRVALQSFRTGAAAAMAMLFLIMLSIFVPVLLSVIGRSGKEEA